MDAIRPIRTKSDYERALREAERLFDAKPGSAAHDRLEVLGMLIDAYEEEHFPIEAPGPVEAIKFTMEQNDFTVGDLAKVLGSNSRASEVLRRQRRLTVGMIHALEKEWGIPASILVHPYRLSRRAA
jgi:antitoxin component HigA of HigAB toxin-antitoxin module